MAVRIALLLDHSDIGETTLLKHSRYRFQSSSIERRVYDGNISIHFIAKQDALPFYLCDERIQYNLRDSLNLSCNPGAGPRHAFHIRKDV